MKVVRIFKYTRSPRQGTRVCDVCGAAHHTCHTLVVDGKTRAVTCSPSCAHARLTELSISEGVPKP